jgi:8-oxo-dGTP pyrophosphatase MutT (NUDIX family)
MQISSQADIPKDIHVLTRAIIIHNDHILCAYDPRLKTASGDPVFYYLPGGHIEYQESATDSLIRELSEETGEQITVKGFIGAFERSWLNTPQSVKCHKHEISLVFKAVLDNKKDDALPSITSKENHKVAFVWLELKNIQNYDIRPSLLKDNIHNWLTVPSEHVFKSVMHIK